MLSKLLSNGLESILDVTDSFLLLWLPLDGLSDQLVLSGFVDQIRSNCDCKSACSRLQIEERCAVKLDVRGVAVCCINVSLDVTVDVGTRSRLVRGRSCRRRHRRRCTVRRLGRRRRRRRAWK